VHACPSAAAAAPHAPAPQTPAGLGRHHTPAVDKM
jgi:hypothetical protein